MDDRMKAIIDKYRAKSQGEKKVIAETPKSEPIPEEDDNNFIEEEQQVVQATPKAQEKEVEIKVNPKNTEDQTNINQQKLIIQQIEALQNNGVFRLEVLGQLTEIKEALTIIAGSIVDLTGKN